MLVKELLSLREEVVKVNFGKKAGADADTGIEVPKGYDRFELDHEEGKLSANIVGIKGNKKTVISRAPIALAKELVKAYNKGGLTDSGLKPLSMMQAFGSNEMNILSDAGIKLTEKPDSWDNFEEGGFAANRNIHEIALKKVEKLIGKLREYNAAEIFGTKYPKSPLVDADLPEEKMCIIMMGNGDRYLVDTTQARTYIRMWQKIV